jgi:hypothetical protein
MINIESIGEGVWHVKQCFPDIMWERILAYALTLPDDYYTHRFEPNRIRLDTSDYPTDPIFQELQTWAVDSIDHISSITGHNKQSLRQHPDVLLWRDFVGYRSGFHPDDYTNAPTLQIYLDGGILEGTSFIIDKRERTLPFLPNSGYLMDNQYQPCHGMINSVGNHVRQSIYIVY